MLLFYEYLQNKNFFYYFREADEIDSGVLELTKEVGKFVFPKDGKPSKETILTGFKDIISDTLFNAVGTVTARKIAEKENFNCRFDPVQKG